MALSQIQCLNEWHVNLRTNASKPEFLYCEEQRLALEKLLDEGPNCYHEFIKTNRVRPFLSDLELAHLAASAEQYCPDLPDDPGGCDTDAGTRLSLQYWPERSEDSRPQLDLGWPQRASYRGVTRVSVHAQPPLHGDAHVKEVIRKAIAQGQKVIAVVMDLFTDVDIFKDLLHASFKRNVAVYIILEVTGVPQFMKMCESAMMHTGHLKNLRVRSIRGTGFFTHSSKRVCGSQSQKFMFIDGDKAISGSYSFTWSASRLDRSIITVLTGQAVDFFDHLFQDLYMMSTAINLNKMKLEKEQTLEPVCKAAPVPSTSTALALKRINPKYALVFGTSAPKSNQIDSKIYNPEQITEMSEGLHIHPGLLHLEKANMIDYLPVWPEPDPPSDVIGFINIRDCNKPLQAHLTRSELFEVSQAIRFKDPVRMPQDSLSKQACPRPTFPIVASTGEQPFVQPQPEPEKDNKHVKWSSLEEQVVCLSHITNPAPAYLSEKDEIGSFVNKGMEKQTDTSSTPREEKATETIIASTIAETCKRISKHLQIHNTVYSVAPNTVTSHNSVIQEETTINPKGSANAGEIINNSDIQDNPGRSTNKPILPYKNETAHVERAIRSGRKAFLNSTSSFSSDEYFECSDSLIVDSEIVGTGNRMQAFSQVPDEVDTSKETLSSLMFDSCENSASLDVLKETGTFALPSASPEERTGQILTQASSDKNRLFDSDSMLQLATESKLLAEVRTDAQTIPDGENTQSPQECELYSVVNHTVAIQPLQGIESAEVQLLLFKPLLQDKVSVPYVPVQKIAEAQCIVFSDTVKEVPLLRFKPETCPQLSNFKSEVIDDTHLTKPATLNTGFLNSRNTERGHEAQTNTEQTKNNPLIAKRKQDIKVRDIHSSSSEIKESATLQIVDKALKLKLKTFKAGQLSDDIHHLKRKTQVHMFVQEEPGVKPKLEKNIRKLHQISPQHKPIPAREVKHSSAKLSASKLHSTNHLPTFDLSVPGVQNDPPGRQSGQIRAANELHASPAKLPRRHTVPTRSNQTRVRPLQIDLSAGSQCSSKNQPQTQQDRTRVNQLHQTDFRHRSTSATEDTTSFRGTLFPKTLRTMKARTTGPSSQTKQKK